MLANIPRPDTIGWIVCSPDFERQAMAQFHGGLPVYNQLLAAQVAVRRMPQTRLWPLNTEQVFGLLISGIPVCLCQDTRKKINKFLAEVGPEIKSRLQFHVPKLPENTGWVVVASPRPLPPEQWLPFLQQFIFKPIEPDNSQN